MPRGGARAGAGRKATDYPGQPLSTYSFTIRPTDTGVLRRFWHGNRSLGLRRLIDQALAAGIAATRSPAHEAALSGRIVAEATAGDKDPLLVRQVVMRSADRRFTARATVEASGRIRIDVPFDPAEAWGPRDRYHVTGTVDGRPVRSVLRVTNGAAALTLGPASGHRRWINDGDPVEVSLRPEGPQAGLVAGDIAAALDAEPEARRAFDSLATFYRKGWLTWIEATKRRPAVRAERIAQMVAQVKGGHKQRPR